MIKKSLKDVFYLGAYYAREDGEIVDYEGNVSSVYADGTVFLRPDYGQSMRIPAHRLIALAFVPNPRELKYVLFKDGNKRNRKPENLKWSSAKHDNTRQSRDPVTGQRVPTKADRILELNAQGMSAAEIARTFDASTQYVYKILRNNPQE